MEKIILPLLSHGPTCRSPLNLPDAPTPGDSPSLRSDLPSLAPTGHNLLSCNRPGATRRPGIAPRHRRRGACGPPKRSAERRRPGKRRRPSPTLPPRLVTRVPSSPPLHTHTAPCIPTSLRRLSTPMPARRVRPVVTAPPRPCRHGACGPPSPLLPAHAGAARPAHCRRPS